MFLLEHYLPCLFTTKLCVFSVFVVFAAFRWEKVCGNIPLHSFVRCVVRAGQVGTSSAGAVALRAETKTSFAHVRPLADEQVALVRLLRLRVLLASSLATGALRSCIRLVCSRIGRNVN
jgi:hypothetical protein